MEEKTTIRSCAFLESTANKKLEYKALKRTSFLTRLLGLIGKKDMRVYIFENCSSIHTMGMSHRIDVAFLSKKGEVMKTIEGLPPWKFASCLGAATTIERIHTNEPWFGQNQHVAYGDDLGDETRLEYIPWQSSVS